MWRYYGQERPPFADEPETGQESVWDFPRPPIVRPESRNVSVQFRGLRLAESDKALKVLETASAPGIYLPVESVDMEMLTQTRERTFCEWKGAASYFDLNAGGESVRRVAWCYADPVAVFAPIAGFISFYPGKVDCYLDGELVKPQPGGYYGGWVTSDIAGPIKGAPGTSGW
jgi:uncharacterized protein (DUF427 family)